MKILPSILAALALIFSSSVFSSDEYPVGIAKDKAFVEVIHQGKSVKIERIQNTNNKLAGDFARTSRPCPPFCIMPIQVAPKVDTIGELELLDFISNQVKNDKGLLIDSRMTEKFKMETIPGAINIPFILFTGDKAEEVLNLLGVKEVKGKANYSEAKELCLFCNGPWCEQAPRAIKALITSGYPTSKIKYYRGGMQLWKIFSLTTVSTENKVADKVEQQQ